MLETGRYTQTANPPRIALSPNAEVLAVAVDSSVEFYDTYTGILYDTVEHVYSGKLAQKIYREFFFNIERQYTCLMLTEHSFILDKSLFSNSQQSLILSVLNAFAFCFCVYLGEFVSCCYV